MYSKKIQKFIKNPGVFFRDYFNKKYPLIFNEVNCPKFEEKILQKHDELLLEKGFEPSFPIDIVFTWVDDTDLKWIERFNLHKKENVANEGLYARDPSRFSNHNELAYSIKSILEFIPWVRTIYIVTDGQDPGIRYGEKIVVIDHKELIPEKYLPTFNSHVIEAHIHNIPNLSEYFIYFNDDVFVARPLLSSHFVKSNGLTSHFVSEKKIFDLRNRGVNTPTLHASFRSSALIERKYGFRADRMLVHSYVPLRKSMFKKVWEDFEEEIKPFLQNKFRSNNDLNLATFLVPWVSFIHGYSMPVREICYYFNIRSRVAKGRYEELLIMEPDELPHSFCLNDFNNVDLVVPNYKDNLEIFLKAYFK